MIFTLYIDKVQFLHFETQLKKSIFTTYNTDGVLTATLPALYNTCKGIFSILSVYLHFERKEV